MKMEPLDLPPPPDVARSRAATYLAHATSFLEGKRWREAEVELLRALALLPHDQRALKLLALVRFKLGRLDEAEAVCRELVAADPDDASIRLKIGLIALKLDRPDDAVRELGRAAELAPDDTRVWTYLGFAYARLGQAARARSAFAKAGQDALADQLAAPAISAGAGQAGAPGGDGPAPERAHLAPADSEGGESANEGSEGLRLVLGLREEPVSAATASTEPETAGESEEAATAAAETPRGESAVAETEAAESPAAESAVVESAAVESPAAETASPESGDPHWGAEPSPASRELGGASGAQSAALGPPGGPEASLDATSSSRPTDEADQGVPSEMATSAVESGAAALGEGRLVAPSLTVFETAFGLEPMADFEREVETPPDVRLATSQPLLSLLSFTLSRLGALDRMAGERGSTAVSLAFRGELHARAAAVVAVSGAIKTCEAHRREQGRVTDARLGEGALAFVRFEGEGEVVLAEPAGVPVTLALADDILYLRLHRLVAFDAEVLWEAGRIPRTALEMVQFRGDGRVVMALVGHPTAIKVTAGRPVTVAAASLVGWAGRIVARGLDAPGFLHCEGEGVVLADLFPPDV